MYGMYILCREEGTGYVVYGLWLMVCAMCYVVSWCRGVVVSWCMSV